MNKTKVNRKTKITRKLPYDLNDYRENHRKATQEINAYIGT